MYSIIEHSEPGELMSFKHIGEIKGGKKQPLDERTKIWSGGKETYFLAEKNGVTKLRVTIDMSDYFVEFFNSAFPKALEVVKVLSEHG